MLCLTFFAGRPDEERVYLITYAKNSPTSMV